MILNIRGTGGAGKTYFARSLVQNAVADFQLPKLRELVDRSKVKADIPEGQGWSSPVTHILMMRDEVIPVYLIGSYDNTCGGCDRIKSQDLICSYVRHFSQFGHVVFEGLMVGHIYGRFAALDDELAKYGEKFVWAYLDTPIEQCIKNTEARRAERGETKPFNPEHTIAKFKSVQNTLRRAREEGRIVEMLKHKQEPYGQLMALMRKYGKGQFVGATINIQETILDDKQN